MKRNYFIKTMLLAVILLVGSGSIGAATATYTIASTSSVTTSGTAPTGSGATYSQTYTTTKGQITGGKSATLTLSGYVGNKITSIVLSMKSNTSAGAGSLNVVAGTTKIATASGEFNTSAWNSAWSTSYVNITKTPTAYSIKSGENVVVTIAATANSLYIQSYSITYAADVVVTAPTLTTPTATSITATTATLGANVTADGGATLTARGTVWGTTASPTGNAVAASGTTTGVFTQARTGFTANTLYYYRGYATNSAGTAYSPAGTFTTLPNAPGVGAGSGATTNSLVANWTAPTGGSAAFTYEIQVDDNSDFSSPAFTQSSIASSSTSATAIGLASGTDYYYRVRATNATGSSVWSSASVAYSTLSANVPALTASALSGFGNICINTEATNSFTISGTALTAQDITVYSEDAGFTLCATADGAYSTSLTFPQSGGAFSQTIYVKFIPTSSNAFNADVFISGGGAEGTLVTASGAGVNSAPAVGTPTATSITATTAVLGGNLSALGCTSVTVQGIEWSTTNGFADGTGTVVSSTGDFVTGAFTQAVTGLAPATTIYYKAFATNAGGTTYTSQSSFATSALSVPVVTDATNISATGFTANWGAVEGATEYVVNVNQKIGGGTQTILSENFDGFSSGSTGSGATSTDISTSLDDYTQTAGWSGSKIYHAGGTSKFGTSSALGYIVTPTINLSANSGAFNLSFQSMAWSGDATDLKIYLDDVLVYTATGLNNSDYTLGSYSVNLTGGTASSKIKFEGKQASKGRFFLENIVITQGGETITPISGSPFTVTETTKAITGLTSGVTYYYTVAAKNGSLSSAASTEKSVTTAINTIVVEASTNASTLPDCPTCDVTVANGAELTIDAAKTYNSITVAPTAKLTNNSALTVSNIVIESDATGTGTIKGDVTGTATVNQYLPGYRTWYLSSPVAGASPTGMNRIKYYDETTNTWSVASTETTPATLPFMLGKGYLVVPNVDVSNIRFEGTLNSGNVSIDLTRSNGNGPKPGFNLIGNPYPSYMDWDLVNDANSSIMQTSTMWYRTKKTNESNESVYQFWTVNGNGVGSPNGASKYIPPMQGFWVRAKVGGGQLQLTNEMRSHAQGTDQLLKAPAANSNTLIRLEVSNGINTDETVLYFNANASYGFDTYDSPKMSNDDPAIAEIFTRAGDEKLVINGMPMIQKDTEIALGFDAGSATSFTLRANELRNLPSDVKLILKDKVTLVETNLTDGVSYAFAPAATTADRFSVIFRTSGAVTGVDAIPAFSGLTAYSNAKNQITVLYDGAIDANTVVSIHNIAGQRVASKAVVSKSTVMDGAFTAGVYIVKLNNKTYKVVVNN